MKTYRFEIYTRNEVTGETGWNIEHRYILSETLGEARKGIKDTPLYDCVIDFDRWYHLDDVDDRIKGQLIKLGWADEITD